MTDNQHVWDCLTHQWDEWQSAVQYPENIIPDGWKEFFTLVTHLISRLPSSKLTKVAIEKGLLRVSAECFTPLDQLIFDRFSQSIALGTSMKCMVCGKYGYRRKSEDFSPCLCNTHYVEYANWLDDNGLLKEVSNVG